MKRNQGFTLIELLIVIAVIGILTAIALTGMSGITKSQKRKQTAIALQNAASMLAEYDAVTALKKQPGEMVTPTGTVATTNIDIWRDADPATALFQGMPSPGNVTEDSATQFTSAPAKNTQTVMNLMMSVPTAKSIISQLPSERLLKAPTGVSFFADAWGNPIIFVPAAGMRGVKLADEPAPYVVTSIKTYKESDLPNTILPPGARPFFVSAGPDGDLTAGDDNIYSFSE